MINSAVNYSPRKRKLEAGVPLTGISITIAD